MLFLFQYLVILSLFRVVYQRLLYKIEWFSGEGAFKSVLLIAFQILRTYDFSLILK